MSRWFAVLLVALLCAVEAWALRVPTVTVVFEPPRPPGRPGPPDAAARAVSADPAGPAFLALMTPDDVARGTWGLLQSGQLAPEQVGPLSELVARGAAQHARLGRLRTERRLRRSTLLSAAADAAEGR